MKKDQVLFPCESYLSGWKIPPHYSNKWVRCNWCLRVKMSVGYYAGRWNVAYEKLDPATFLPENIDQERKGFDTAKQARDYCDRAAVKQGFILH